MASTNDEKSKMFINSILSSLSQIINNSKTQDKSQAFMNNISTSLSQLLNKNKEIKEKGLSSVSSKSKTEYTKREPRSFGKPNIRSVRPMSEKKKLGIEEYINKLKETIDSLNDIIITETLYNKNREIIRSETDCFDKNGKKQDCKQKSVNENKSMSIIPDLKNKLNELIDTDKKEESKIDEFVNETVSIIKYSQIKDDITEELTLLENTPVVIKKEDEIKYDIIQTIIRKVLDSLLTK